MTNADDPINYNNMDALRYTNYTNYLVPLSNKNYSTSPEVRDITHVNWNVSFHTFTKQPFQVDAFVDVLYSNNRTMTWMVQHVHFIVHYQDII